MSFSVHDIVAFAKVAWHVYEIGFGKYQSASKLLCPSLVVSSAPSPARIVQCSSSLGQEYGDFGNDIRNFAQGLDSIQAAVHRAKDQAPFIANDWDLTSLQSIVGDIGATIKQCEDLILRNSKFERDGFGFVKNISWSLGMAEKVRSLRCRVSFHCSKVCPRDSESLVCR